MEFKMNPKWIICILFFLISNWDSAECMMNKTVHLDRNTGLLNPPTKVDSALERAAIEDYFDQRLDHFNTTNNETWKQVYLSKNLISIQQYIIIPKSQKLLIPVRLEV